MNSVCVCVCVWSDVMNCVLRPQDTKHASSEKSENFLVQLTD
jgi:hypothetical protein